MIKTEYTEDLGFVQRNIVEHEEYAKAYSTELLEMKELHNRGTMIYLKSTSPCTNYD